MISGYKKNTGFTLIELMIVVAILGILAGIAYPSFSDSMKKGRRADAKTGLLRLAMAQSKLRGSCSTFAGSIGSSNDCDGNKVKGSEDSENGYYKFSISGATGNAYTLTATAQGAQTKDTGCTSMKVAFSASYPKGNKTPTACW